MGRCSGGSDSALAAWDALGVRRRRCRDFGQFERYNFFGEDPGIQDADADGLGDLLFAWLTVDPLFSSVSVAISPLPIGVIPVEDLDAVHLGSQALGQGTPELVGDTNGDGYPDVGAILNGELLDEDHEDLNAGAVFLGPIQEPPELDALWYLGAPLDGARSTDLGRW